MFRRWISLLDVRKTPESSDRFLPAIVNPAAVDVVMDTSLSDTITSGLSKANFDE